MGGMKDAEVSRLDTEDFDWGGGDYDTQPLPRQSETQPSDPREHEYGNPVG